MQIAIYISINNNHLSSFAQIYLIIDIDALHTVVCWTHNGTIKTFISVEKVNICLCIRILKLLSSDILLLKSTTEFCREPQLENDQG